jgi:hypothetical protein
VAAHLKPKRPAQSGRVLQEDIFEMNQDAIKLSAAEQKAELDKMKAALAAYTGPIKQIPQGKRVTRKPSKKAGESGSLQGAWGDKQSRWAWGE